MNRPLYKVLVLCTGNSARSVIGEYLLRHFGQGRFETHSAGSKPTGRVNPLAVWVLKEHYGIDASASRSKSWNEFKDAKFDVVITVCDHAKESCPIFPGAPITAHFSSPDPADARGTEAEQKQLFVTVARQIQQRMQALCALPDVDFDRAHIQAIGEQFKVNGESGMAR